MTGVTPRVCVGHDYRMKAGSGGPICSWEQSILVARMTMPPLRSPVPIAWTWFGDDYLRMRNDRPSRAQVGVRGDQWGMPLPAGATSWRGRHVSGSSFPAALSRALSAVGPAKASSLDSGGRSSRAIRREALSEQACSSLGRPARPVCA